MDTANRNIKPAPFVYGPPIKWLENNGRSESCGYSGDKNCAFIVNKDDRLKAQEEALETSQKKMPDYCQKR